MNRRANRILAAAAACIMVAAASAALTLGGSLARGAAAVPATAPGGSREQGRYTLRQEDGLISVFSGGRLILRTGIEVASLPKSDREALNAGVYADTMDRVLRLLEDYGS